MDNRIERPYPHALGPEKSVLSSMLKDPQGCIGIAIEQKANKDFFYLPAHKILFEVLVNLYEASKEIELVSLSQILIDKGLLEGIGGVAYLTDLYSYALDESSFSRHLELVKDKYVLRSIIQQSNDAISSAYESPEEIEELLDKLEGNLFKIRDDRFEAKGSGIKPLIKEVVGDLQALLSGKKVNQGLATGFTDLDRMTSGLKPGDMMVIAARPSVGKAQPLWSQVLTPNGFVNMGDLSVGDFVIGLDGKPKKIKGIFPQGKKECFKVNLSDRSFTHACSEHLWVTRTRNEKRFKRGFTIKSTKQISETINRPDGGKRNHFLPAASAVDFGNKGDLPIHPWLLGALIGDGGLGSDSICITKPEFEVLNKVKLLLPAGDSWSDFDGGVRIVRRGMKSVSSTRYHLSKLGLKCKSEYKFIPKQYLYASINDRFELLQGLIDTDGSVAGTRIEYSTSSEQLGKDVIFLLRSLGITCSIKKRQTYYTYLGKRLPGLPSWRIHFLAKEEYASTEKHLNKIQEASKRNFRCITSVESIGMHECQCISVDSPDGIYLTDDFIPTHNTGMMMNIVEHVCIDLELPGMVFSCEMTEKQLVQRLLYARAEFSLSSLSRGKSPTKHDLQNIKEAAIEIGASKIFIDDTPNISINELRAKARRKKREENIQFIAIDYLQLMRSTSKQGSNNREREIAEISSGVKGLAKELSIPIIVLAQLNRNSESRSGKNPGIPKMSDLRESGAIEQDADMVGLLYRPSYHIDDEDEKKAREGEAQLILAKNRNGETGVVDLEFFPEIMKFKDAD